MTNELSITTNETSFSVNDLGNFILTVTQYPGYLALESRHAFSPNFKWIYAEWDYSAFEKQAIGLILAAWKHQNIENVHLEDDSREDDELFQAILLFRPELEANWERLRESIIGLKHPIIVSIQEAIGKAIGQDCRIALNPSVIDNPGLVADLLGNRAAAIAAGFIVELSGMKFHDTWAQDYWEEYQDMRRADEIFLALVEENYSGEVDPSSRNAITLLEDWRSLFSNDGMRYSALDGTLNQLPADMNSDLLRYLPQCRLDRFITDRLELTAVLSYARRHPHDFNGKLLMRNYQDEFIVSRSKWPEKFKDTHANIGHLLQTASAQEIRQGMKMVSEYTGLDLNPDQDEAVTIFINFLDGFNSNVAEDFQTFLYDVIVWKCDARNAAEKFSLSWDMEIPHKKLPSEQGIRFLKTSLDVQEAAALFEFDLSNEYSVSHQPSNYYFLINHDRQQGLIIMDTNGLIVRAFGIDQKPNKATEWATDLFLNLGWLCYKGDQGGQTDVDNENGWIGDVEVPDFGDGTIPF